jgi:hypothetical protein
MASLKASNYCPKATRRKGFLVEEVGGDVLVYNLEAHRAHCLNDPAVRIWKLCNGRRTVKQIAAEFQSDLEPAARELVVRSAVGQFSRLGLVQAHSDAPIDMSRRELARRIGIGAAIALPLISSILAPTPAMAGSLNDGTACTLSSQCASACCNTMTHLCNEHGSGNSGHCQ